jgi:hypothetical protein
MKTVEYLLARVALALFVTPALPVARAIGVGSRCRGPSCCFWPQHGALACGKTSG